ncbi:hypothetical protein N566_05250 [Streptomycetaceae bacterium MP113-05]|nr:hypothetical protein N566_05250 [Streptomycetaceae bacterium MP113-05]
MHAVAAEEPAEPVEEGRTGDGSEGRPEDGCGKAEDALGGGEAGEGQDDFAGEGWEEVLQRDGEARTRAAE